MQKHTDKGRSNLLSKITAVAAVLLALSAPAAQAGAIIDFDSAAIGIPSTPYIEDGFTFTQDIDPGGSVSPGTDGVFAADGAGGINDNGTQIFGWCGYCFPPNPITLSLSNNSGALFDVTSIDFGSLSVSSGVPILIATGNFEGGESVTTSFTSVPGTLTTFFFGASFSGLTSLDLVLGDEFEAGGSSDGAIDNIVLGGIASVPEPTSMFLFGSGLLGLALRRRRQV